MQKFPRKRRKTPRLDHEQPNHTQPRQGLTAAPGLFSPSSVHPGQSVPAAAVPGLCYTLRPACPLCVPVRPVAGFCAVRGFLYHPGHKNALRGEFDRLRHRTKESPGRLSTCPGLCGLSEFQAGFLALPVGHKGGYIVRGLHGDIVQGQPVRGHVVALTIPGEKFATLHA